MMAIALSRNWDFIVADNGDALARIAPWYSRDRTISARSARSKKTFRQLTAERGAATHRPPSTSRAFAP